MPAGQPVLPTAVDDALVGVLEARLERREVGRSTAHADQLRDAFSLEGAYRRQGLALSVVPQLALVLRCSEHRAVQLLRQAHLLDGLVDGWEVLEGGLLTVEQCAALPDLLEPLDPLVRHEVWERLRHRLGQAGETGEALPPARLTELLRRWIARADPRGDVERRRRAEDTADVEHRRRDDGLVDLYLLGMTGPNAQSALARIAARSRPFGPDDTRPAGKRRLDAAVDLLTGRDTLSFDDAVRGTGSPLAALSTPPTDDPGLAAVLAASWADQPSGCPRPGCGCPLGAAVPCGAQVLVHLPIGGALGTTDEPAELVGHGAVDTDLLTQLLHAAPALRPVWVEAGGVPVAVGDRVVTPERNDPQSVRQALLHLAGLPPPPHRHPRHPADHDPPGADGVGSPHLDGPGSYRPSPRLRRLVEARSPRCEWPGCGARASRCDFEHDLAWPDGPTCACNGGPLCRRHHRVKQEGWRKQRTVDAGVRWTSPTGRTWTSPPQHPAPEPPTRRLPALPRVTELDLPSPQQIDDELRHLDPGNPCWDAADDTHLAESDPVEAYDHLGEAILDGSTRWSLDLLDPYAWT